MSYATQSSGAPKQTSGAGVERRGRILIPTIVVLVVLVLLLVVFTGFYTDFLWFKSTNNSQVYTRQLGTRVGLFLVFGLVMALGVGASMTIAYRLRPMSRMRTPEQLSLERYRAGIEPLRRPLAFLIPIVIGLLAGISASSEWRTWSLWRNQEPFGATDPQFGHDIGYYMFSYPWLRFLLGFGFALIILALLTGLVVHYLYGGIRLQPPGPRVSNAAQTQLSILLGLFCLLKAAAYWLDRFGLALKSEDLVNGFTGLKYRDIHALLPAKSILVLIALICAILFFVNAFRRSWPVAGAGLALLVVSALVIGGIYPAIVQQFQVKPSELTKEAPSIQNNIKATRAAYGVDNVQTQTYDAVNDPNKATLAKQQGTLDNIRIVDPSVVSPTFQALQQNRSFYTFPDTLDIDRYMLDSAKTKVERGAVVSVRDLNLDGVASDQRNWANDHLVYTHGYGFVGAEDNSKDVTGNPVFFEKNIPPTGQLDVTQPRIYFGENSPQYSIVGGASDSTPRELDYPDDTAANGQRNNTYTGTGGVPVGSPIERFLFAVKYQEPNILLSSLINSDSRILWDRDPRTVVGKVAPWLQLDTDPYPVAVGGRIKWIVDGYTTSNTYPYSSRVTLSDATSDSTVQRVAPGLAPPRDEINYIRNSVKAVVDAYDGTVTLYGWDESDPILRTWEKVFPGIVQPKESMPAELLAHVRYPEDAFKVQRLIFSRYHVTDPQAFYSGQDFWVIPKDPTKEQQDFYQPPYYLNLQMPGQATPSFALTTTFAPTNRPTLAAIMSADSRPGENFGKFTLLQLPRNTTIPGPLQVQNSFESNTTVAAQLSLLRQGGSEVDLGNLLSLPVGDGVLYVEPVYVKQAGQTGYPLLKKVLVSFGEVVVMADTLPAALAQAGIVPGVDLNPGGGGGNRRPSPTDTLQQQLASALKDAQSAYEDGQRALRSNDFAQYGAAQKRLEISIRRAQDLQKQIAAKEGGSKVTPAALDAAATAEMLRSARL